MEINRPNYTVVPRFHNLSQYTYLEAYYSDSYYRNRHLYLTYVLSNGQVLSFGALMAGLPSHYHVDLGAINLTVNYSYVYDCWGNAILDDNITTSYAYMGSSYSLYNTFYSSASNNYNFFQLPITNSASTRSTILSQLGNEGNPSPINSFGSSPSAQGDRLLLLSSYNANHNHNVVDMVATDGSLLVLTNTNLLYIYTKKQLQTLTSGNANSVSNLTAFEGY